MRVALLAYPTAYVAASAPSRQCFDGDVTEKVQGCLRVAERNIRHLQGVVHPPGTMAQAIKYVILVRGQDDQHGLGKDRIDHSIRRGREEAVDQMRPRDRLGLRAPVALEPPISIRDAFLTV